MNISNSVDYSLCICICKTKSLKSRERKKANKKKTRHLQITDMCIILGQAINTWIFITRSMLIPFFRFGFRVTISMTYVHFAIKVTSRLINCRDVSNMRCH